MQPAPRSAAKEASGGRAWGWRPHVGALLGLFAAEWALFTVCTHRHFAWAYPRWVDQLQYLKEAYGSYDVMSLNGFAAGARHALGLVSPQGSLHGFLALLVFCAAGPTRDAALSVNLFAFLALQASLFAAVRRVSGSWPLAWAAVGLLVAVHSPWAGAPGSAVDFRLDWMAACAYGVALCAAVAGGGFRSARWALLFGAAVGAALLVRHLTAAYFGLIYALLGGWLLCRPGRWRRVGNLALSGVFALAISGWAYWRSRSEIYAYYWLGHFAGPERGLRERHMGLAAGAKWMGSEMLVHQFGVAAAALGVAAGAALLALRLAWPRRSVSPAGAAATAWPEALAFLVAPAAVLMAQPEKARQPLGIMIPPLIWLVVLVWMRLARKAPATWVAAVSACAVLCGAALFARAELAEPYDASMTAEYRDVNALGDFLYFRSEEAGLSRPKVAVNWNVDALSSDVFEVLGRERHGRPMPFTATLPTGLFAADPALVRERLAESDFVCLVTRAPQNWPFDRQMAAMLPEARLWCDAHLKHDADLEGPGFSVSVYERPGMGGPARGVDLAAMLAAGRTGPAYTPARPPVPPVFTPPGTVLWTTKAAFSIGVRAAYGPLRYSANGLPEGLGIDPGSGEIRGWFRKAGTYAAEVTAVNALGSATVDVPIQVTDETWGAVVAPVERAVVGKPVEIGFTAFDSAGSLNFVDVSDLTTGKTLGRLVPGEGEKGVWRGTYRTAFAEAGPHEVLLRFVRLDAAQGGSYVFTDRGFRVEVSR
jgi:Putative Ig domain